jgi:hypothetical protein
MSVPGTAVDLDVGLDHVVVEPAEHGVCAPPPTIVSFPSLPLSESLPAPPEIWSWPA